MIEVYFITKKKDYLRGYINGRDFFDKKQRRGCRVDLNTVYFHSKAPIMQLIENGDIINIEKSKPYESGEILGYMRNFQIFDSLNEPYYRLSKEEGILYAYSMEENTPWLRLVGDLTNIDEIVFLGLCFYFLDIFC